MEWLKKRCTITSVRVVGTACPVVEREPSMNAVLTESVLRRSAYYGD